MTNRLLTKPSLTGMMRESASYRVMNTGLTDTIMLIGHADAQVMYEPYQVIDIKQAISFLNADTNSPLLRGLLEAYNGGCKDIWLYAAAPMKEYEPDLVKRFDPNFLNVSSLLPAGNLYPGLSLFPSQAINFYQKWFTRLGDAYTALSSWDVNEIIVPLEAIFYDSRGVDFVTQLINFCSNSFAATGVVTLGVLGTRIAAMTTADITAMANDSRLTGLGTNGKFVMVAVGEGIINHPQISTSYANSLAVQVGSIMATTNLGRSVAGVKLPNTSALIGNDYTDAQLELLTQAKLNPIVRTQRGKRGAAFETRLITDNTLGIDGTDYWSMTQMHIVANCVNQIRSYGYAYIGENADLFKKAVYAYLDRLQHNKYIAGFTLDITMQASNTRALVTVGITPIFGIRTIYFSTTVGPGA